MDAKAAACDQLNLAHVARKRKLCYRKDDRAMRVI